jgi:hypothetical protein
MVGHSAHCSDRLSYVPVVSPAGLEPAAPGFGTRRSVLAELRRHGWRQAAWSVVGEFRVS